MAKKAAVASQMDVEIGTRIRIARRERQLSQKALGTAVGITFQQMQKYEKGDNRVSVTRLYRIAEQLGLPLSYFVDGLKPRRAEAASHNTLTPSELLKTSDALKLITAFNRIESSSLRKRCVELVQSLAQGQHPD
jgi:transcriptional regulator with XRE-family HTH domain